jgi:hypothetical protein
MKGDKPTERMLQIGEMAHRAYRQKHSEKGWPIPPGWDQLSKAQREAWAEAGLVAFNMGVEAITRMQADA